MRDEYPVGDLGVVIGVEGGRGGVQGGLVDRVGHQFTDDELGRVDQILAAPGGQDAGDVLAGVRGGDRAGGQLQAGGGDGGG